MTPTPPAAGSAIKSENMSRTASENSNASVEAAKPKRKGTRSVASLTPSQLARKRANDREAQRAIRARTKEHIEKLEREVATLKNHHSSAFVADLIDKNARLEHELQQWKAKANAKEAVQTAYPNMQNAAAAYHSHTPPTTVFDEAALGQGMASPRSSPYPNSAFEALEDLNPAAQPFMSMDGTNMYTASSAASSPASSSNQEDYSSYIPTSMSAPMGISVAGQQTTLAFRPTFEEGEADSVYAAAAGLGQHFRHAHHQQPQGQHEQQHMSPQQQGAAWPYPSYYQPPNSSIPPTN